MLVSAYVDSQSSTSEEYTNEAIEMKTTECSSHVTTNTINPSKNSLYGICMHSIANVTTEI